MPKLSCLCGEVINLSAVPNEQTFPLFSDQQLEDLQDTIAARLRHVDDNQKSREVNVILCERRPNAELIECPTCGRLAFFSSPGENVPAIWYLPEKVTNPKISRLRDVFRIQ